MAWPDSNCLRGGLVEVLDAEVTIQLQGQKKAGGDTATQQHNTNTIYHIQNWL